MGRDVGFVLDGNRYHGRFRSSTSFRALTNLVTQKSHVKLTKDMTTVANEERKRRKLGNEVISAETGDFGPKIKCYH